MPCFLAEGRLASPDGRWEKGLTVASGMPMGMFHHHKKGAAGRHPGAISPGEVKRKK